MNCFTKLSVFLVWVMVTLHGVKADLLEECTSDAECTATDGDPNAVCEKEEAVAEDETRNCICTGGFKNNGDNTGCVAKVLGDPCEVESDCTGSVNSVCSTEDKCECKEHYIEENAMCKKALGQTCSVNGDCVSNAECEDEKCKCSSSFTNTNGLCAAESSATSAWVTSSLLVTSLLIYLPTLILL